MQQVEAGRVALDAPAARYLPALGRDGPTVRQLLQHRSGLRNPEDGAADRSGAPASLPWCLAGRARAGGPWRYNNCDYVVLGALVERATRRPLAEVYAERIAGPTGMGALFQAAGGDNRADANWTGGPTAAERATLVQYGAAGGLVGTAEDVLAFDAALLDGRLLGTRARAELWRGDARLGHQALGQWSFTAPLRGCVGAVPIVERRGGIGRFQLRNVILPGSATSMVLLTPDGDYDFGEIWQGKGATYDALSAACPGGDGA
jgi:CubicO group peptidase (beta-lactamase class C family)